MTKQLLHPHQLHEYQRQLVIHQLTHDDSMLWVGMGLGKEQPDSEPVLTPYGWQPIGNITPGDYVIGQNGSPIEVEAVFPQGIKEVLKVTFNDGSFTHCGWDHLWNVRTDKCRHQNKPYRTMSIRDIVDSGLTSKNGKNGTMLKWSIPMVEPVRHSAKSLSIDPYLLGVLLGDGSGVELCTDIEIIERCGLKVSKPHESSIYTGYAYVSGIKQKMRDMNILGNRSWEKFVPVLYMNGSIGQRVALLRGLLDTDGSPIEGGGVEFSSTSEQLADAVVELAESLGGIGRKKGPRITRHQNGEGRPSWRVNVKIPSDFTPFTLKRKLNKWQRPTKYEVMRKIKSVEVVRHESSRCIRVKAEDNLYVTRHHIVTHNTPTTLTTIVDRMNAGQVKKTLIFGPLRVIQAVWAREARKWSHTQHLRFSIITGTKEKRSRALFANADIFLCNYENMNWLAQELDHYYVSQGKPLPFEMVVYDEVSKLKNSTTKRVKGGFTDREDKWGHVHKIKKVGWRKMIDQFKYRTGLTGTPASNGYLDLHGQYLAVDGGERLGPFVTHFKDSYFASDYNGWGHTVTKVGKQLIEEKISDITIKMDSKEYLDMPAVKVVNMMVDLPMKVRKQYDEIEKEMFTKLDNGTELEVFSRSAVSNKCLQFANGSPYLHAETDEYEELHNAKLDALEEVLEEAGGSPVLCSYSYKSDAERIMKKFKKYKPVNMTTAKSSETEGIINRWNNGQIKLLIGHPACLHPDTLVLTESRGWVKIIEVKNNERVHDGVEFVSHSGCSYSGHKEVIDVFGVTMTPNHKLLINDEWIEAKDVENSEDVKRKALYKYQGDDESIGGMFTMSNSIRDGSSELRETQQDETYSLQTLRGRQIPQDDWKSYLADMAGFETPFKRRVRQGLRWSWNNLVQRVGAVRELLQGYVTIVSRSSDHRTCRCEQGLLEGQLHMDNGVRSAGQQAEQSSDRISRRINPLGRVVSAFGLKSNRSYHAVEQGNDWRSSCSRCDELTLRKEQYTEEQETTGIKKEHVYDLVDCGPRHRFLIKNPSGEVFISHNSMGHGVDGLQDSGSIVVWFGCSWSLELYEQMNARIDRQGQTKPVSVIRILCNDTVDLAVVDALERKTDDQDGLKKSLQRYRDGYVTNDFDINFF